jgi:hypothetical protein
MARKFLLGIALFIAIGCSDQGPRAVSPENATEMVDPVEHELLKEALKKNNIKYRTDTSGMIWYSPSDEEQVRKIMLSIVLNDVPADRSVGYTKGFGRDLFVAEMARNGIKYEVKIRHGHEWFVWEEKDSPRVKKILDFVSDQTLAHFQKIVRQRKKLEPPQQTGSGKQ